MKQHTIRVKSTCSHIAHTGPCKKATVVTHPYCPTHTQDVLGLKVAKSKIKGAGFGLFAAKAFRKGDQIVQYDGEILTNKQYESRYGDVGIGAYGIELNDNHVVDAARTSSGVARYACSFQGSGLKAPNAEYVSDDKEVWIVATRKIAVGEEIYTDYGDDMIRAMGV